MIFETMGDLFNNYLRDGIAWIGKLDVDDNGSNLEFICECLGIRWMEDYELIGLLNGRSNSLGIDLVVLGCCFVNVLFSTFRSMLVYIFCSLTSYNPNWLPALLFNENLDADLYWFECFFIDLLGCCCYRVAVAMLLFYPAKNLLFNLQFTCIIKYWIQKYYNLILI